jgi:hypothetical protein
MMRKSVPGIVTAVLIGFAPLRPSDDGRAGPQFARSATFD